MSKPIDFKKISAHKSPEASPGFLLWHVSTSWRSSIERALKKYDLTHPQFVILASLGWLTREENLVSQARVGKMAGLDPNTTSQIIRGLEKKELLCREPSADGRVKNPLLTEKGKKVLSRALPAVEREDQYFFNSLSKTEIDSLLTLFERLTNPEHIQENSKSAVRQGESQNLKNPSV